MRHLVFRVDANAAIGSGHAIRCLALAQAWRRQGGAARFASADLDPKLEREIASRGFELQQLTAAYPDPSDAAAVVSAAASRQGGGWIVIDGYRFTTDYHRHLRAAGWPLCVIDDYAHLDYYDADVLLNQNVGAESLAYCGEPPMRRLLGTSYALLRDEFINTTPSRRPVPESVTRVLLLMGGGDPQNVTSRVLQAMTRMSDRPANIRVVVGPSNPYFEDVVRLASSAPAVEVLQAPADIPRVMDWADLAVTAAGSTCWELAYLGVPMITIVVAENQRGIADGLATRGAAVNLGWHGEVTLASIAAAIASLADDHRKRASMRRAARELVDGCGADRVVAALAGN